MQKLCKEHTSLVFFGVGQSQTPATLTRSMHASHLPFKDYPQVINGRCMEDTFGQLEKQGVVACHCENICNGCHMSFKRWCAHCNSNVIHADLYECAQGFMFGDGIMVEAVHHCLKGCRRVSETKEHDCQFIKASPGFKCSFVFIPFLYPHIVVSPVYIKLREYVCSPQVSYTVSDVIRGRGYWFCTIHLLMFL